MELVIKISATAICVALLNLIIKRYNPELSTVLSICTVCVIFLAAGSFAGVLVELMAKARKISGISDIYIVAVYKCLAISILTKISSELCKDANQASLAAAVEMGGSFCALGIVVPLLYSMLEMLGDMI